jgi:hypothetical protein
MTIHLNKYTKEHLLEVCETLQKFYSLSGNSARKDAVLDVYRAFAELLRVVIINDNMKSYLITKSGAAELTPESVLMELENVKGEMLQWQGDEWSADYPLRAMFIGLKDSEIKYPDSSRGFLQKSFGIGEISKEKRETYEENLLQPVAKYLIAIVNDYYQHKQTS